MKFVKTGQPRLRWARRAGAVAAVLALAALPAVGRAADDDDWIRADTRPKPTTSKQAQSLLGAAIDVPGLAGNEIDLDAMKILPQMRFSADRKHVFILEKAGVLRKLTYPAMEQVGQITIGSRCSRFSVCRSGLMICLDGKEQLWIVDPDTLAVVKKFDVDLISAASGSTHSDVVWAKVGERTSAELAAIDVRVGKVVRKATLAGWGAFRRTYPRPGSHIRPNAFSALSGVANLAVAPNGRYLIVTERGRRIGRYRIAGTKLVPEELQWIVTYKSERLPFTISDDGQYVSTWFMDRKIFKLTDFSKPVIQGTEQPWPHHEVLAFDRLGRKIYAGGTDSPSLWSINSRGLIEKQYGLPRGSGATLQILLHPTDGTMLVLTEHKLFRVRPVEAVGAGATSQPAGGAKALASRVVTVPGAKITCLMNLAERTDGKPAGGIDPQGWCCWSHDGRSFYWLGQNSKLVRIDTKSFELAAEAEFKYRPKWLGMSAAGLVTYSPKAQELLVIDPLRLKTRQAIAIPASPAVTDLAASPALRRVLLYHQPVNRLRWVDLNRGPGKPFDSFAIRGIASADWPRKMLGSSRSDSKQRFHDLARQIPLFCPKLSPNGATLFTGRGTLYAFRVRGEELTMIAATETGGGSAGPFISPDGQRVTVAGTHQLAERVVDRRPIVRAWLVAGFPRPAGKSVRTERDSAILALGPGSLAYTAGKAKTLTICDLATGTSRDIQLPDWPIMLAAHPNGRLVVAVTKKDLMFVELAPAAPHAKENDSK